MLQVSLFCLRQYRDLMYLCRTLTQVDFTSVQIVYIAYVAALEGNLLIRPAPSSSRSPYNFEIVLLDHGLYFDLTDELRFNYAKLWIALIDNASPECVAERRKYAELVGNIGPDLVRIFSFFVVFTSLKGMFVTFVTVFCLRSCYYRSGNIDGQPRYARK